MNTILVPIDFSETSDNALNYAIGLANYLSSNIVLLHVDTTPVYVNEYDAALYTIRDSIASSIELLKEKTLKIRKENILIGDVNYFVEEGDLKSVIREYITKKNIDLIVMGITGHDTQIGKALLGSNAISVSRESDVPVFIISKKHPYKKIKNIAYACEYDSEIKEQTGLIQIKYINTLFDSKLSVLHVIPHDHIVNKIEAETDLYVEEKLENTNHNTFVLSEDNVSNALLQFIKTHDIDLIVLEQKKHSFLHKLIYPSATKAVAFSSPVPVLTIKS